MTVRRPHLRHFHTLRATTIAVGALAAGMFMGAGPVLAQNSTSNVDRELAKGQVDHAIALGEAAVAVAPQDAARRADLGRAYIKAGRFESAAMMLAAAQAMGDRTGRTALNLALAESACGRGREAIAVLDAARGHLPVVDYGLALALAGNAERGVAVLSEDLRMNDHAPTLRQNLGYAYALAGRWADARMIISLDLPADQVDARLTQWAASAQPEAYRQRVAMLLGVPQRSDTGAPAGLAMSGGAAGNAMNAGGGVDPSAPANYGNYANAGYANTGNAGYANAGYANTGNAGYANAGYANAGAPTSVPVVENTSEFAADDSGASQAPVTIRAARPVRVRTIARAPAGSHTVQLGAFDSQQMAEHARQSYAHNPALARHQLAITQAVVNGHTYWRVTVSGIDETVATNLCGSIRHGGGACFAHPGGHAPGEEALAMANTRR